MLLRPYQIGGIEQVRMRLRTGKRRILFVLPTGGGKTVVAAHIVVSAVELGSRVLFVAHRRELIKQAFAKLVRNGIPPEQIGIVMAGVPATSGRLFGDGVPSSDDELWRDLARRRPQAPIQIASIDTLRNRTKPPADLVIIDEAHRCLAASYVALVADYPLAVHLGLTATPYRADGKGLGEVYEDLVGIASPRLLIEEGFLVEPRVFTVPACDLPDLSSVRVKGGDYDEKALAIAVDREGLVGNIVEHWKKLAGGVRTVAFASSVAHSKHIAESFCRAGVPAEHLDGETETAVRDAILRRLDSGETIVVSNCGVLCEGWDQPSVKCAILARPTKSLGLYLQQAGRILRPFEGLGAIILDHAGCALEHGLPQDDREYSLLAQRKRAGASTAVPVRTCEQCYAVLPGGTRVCPVCGFVFASADAPSVPEEGDGQLIEVRGVNFEEKKQVWDQLCATALERGYKPGWAVFRYREKFGVAPPFKFPANRLSEEQRRAEFDKLIEICRHRGYKMGWALVQYKKRFGENARLDWATEAAVVEAPKEAVPWAM